MPSCASCFHILLPRETAQGAECFVLVGLFIVCSYTMSKKAGQDNESFNLDSCIPYSNEICCANVPEEHHCQLWYSAW